MNDPKIALVTTTINIPNVLSLYRACNDDVRFFVAGDEKTREGAREYVEGLSNARYIVPQDQLRWECSGYIGFNCIQRRNIATLEALEWGAEILVYLDDDNITLDTGYFDHFIGKFSYPFSGPCVHGFNGWFDPGSLLRPPVKHRGFPFNVDAPWGVKGITDARIGVCAGMCFGDPDIESVTRMAMAPNVHGVCELGRAGVVVDPLTFTVFNSQNTGFLRELAPALFLPPACGRYDDIFASLICQRVMRERELHVHIGQPFVHQDRNHHGFLADLKAEIFGMEHVETLGQWLDHKTLAKNDTVWDHVDRIYDSLEGVAWMPTKAIEAAQAWLRDIEKVMT